MMLRLGLAVSLPCMMAPLPVPAQTQAHQDRLETIGFEQCEGPTASVREEIAAVEAR